MDNEKALNILIAISIITLFLACGCAGSDEPLKADVVITSQTRDLTTLEITNNNWYDWTDVNIVAYSTFIPTYGNIKFGAGGPNLMESGKTYTVKIGTGRNPAQSASEWNHWDGKFQFISIEVFTVKGAKQERFVTK
ncbi:MAG: hypothetical protein ABSG90_04710 [Dehalococcoidia bacterium]|jgi:hypothetical protein